MSTPHRDKLSILHLEDRVTPAVVIPAEVLNADPSTYAAGRVLFSIASGADRNQTLTALGNSPWASTAQELGFGVFKLTLRPGVTVRQTMEGLNGNGWLGFVEPDYKVQVRRMPNDPQYPDQWGMNNTGQSGGMPDADIDAPEGWALARGTGQTVVAVFDDGIDSTHPDLAANMWVNTGEIPGNGIDDDGNGHIDDVRGYDFSDDDGDARPDGGNDHGTHVAGIIGAVGDNGIGVTGVAWQTRLMSIKIDGSGGGYVSAATSGVAYAINHGAKIFNNSWGYTGPESKAYTSALAGAQAAGVIVVSAPNNFPINQDVIPDWPANYTGVFDNAISVTALNRFNQKANFAAFGPQLVTVAAPGVDIWSTLPGGTYGESSGTSMATPVVSGTLAVVWDAFPNLTYQELIQLMKESVDIVPDLQGQILTGGSINLHKMIQNATFAGYAVGADAGGEPLVRVFAPDGSQRTAFYAYDTRFRGGVRIAMADVNGDRVPDIIAVPGSGGGPNVRVFDGRTLELLYSFQAYSETFTAGLYVAAGDLDGDGFAELITGAGEGGGPNVRVYKLGANGAISLLNSFYAYTDGFTGGVRVAVGDYDGDGIKDIVTSPGYGGGPHIKVFDGNAATSGQAVVLAQFMAGDPRANVGAYVALGNITSDGIADFIVGSGAGDREVRVYDGRTLAFQSGFNVYQPGTTTPLATSTTITPPPTVGGLVGGVPTPTQLPANKAAAVAAASGPSAGLRVAVLDLNRDGVDDIIAAGGAGDQSVVHIRNGQSMTPLYADRTVFGGFVGGVFVAASR